MVEQLTFYDEIGDTYGGSSEWTGEISKVFDYDEKNGMVIKME